MTEIEGEAVGTSQCAQEYKPGKGSGSRKEKRMAAKKEKRKQLRKELAEKAREEEEARLNDPEEQRRIQLEEEREIERLERERKQFQERERLFLEELATKKAEEEEEDERRKSLEEELKRNQAGHENVSNEDDDWEYVEEGPPEIIWQGNEIIVKKNRVRVKKKDADQHTRKEDADRPTSNPLPPQSEAFSDYQNAPAISAQQLLENVAQQVPNFGTEQDKAHCPFHIKTGACRFGLRCSRVHFYPDKSCTLLMKNMYNGPGLAWEQDEGLENSFYKLLRWRFKLLALVCSVIYDITNSYTDEEVDRCYEEFYEDVHTEFLKNGEIVNFKVCRNGAFHLRGNLYVHYKSSDSAVMAYHSMNGRYFAGKQVKCEFVGVTRWKIAICGEYMKSRLKTCSRGTACNFIHCFRNPGGDYEWADWDKPPPRYWMNKMTALFGYSDESGYDKQMEQENFGQPRKSSKMLTTDRDRYHFRRSRSRERESSNGRSSKSHYEDDVVRRSTHRHRLTSSDGQKRRRTLNEKNCEETNSKSNKYGNIRTSDTDSDGDCLDSDRNREAFRDRTRKSSRRHRGEVQELREYDGGSTNRTHETESDRDYSDCDADRDGCHDRKRKSSRDRKKLSERHGEPHDRTIDGDKDWSGLDRDEETHHDRTRKHRRHRHNQVSEYLEYHGGSNNRTHETDSDGDLSDGDRKRDGHHGHKRKSSRNMRKVSDVQNDFGNSWNESHVTDFDEDRLHEDRDSHGRRRGSKSRKKVSEIHDDSRDNKNGAHAADSHAGLLIEDRYTPEDGGSEKRNSRECNKVFASPDEQEQNSRYRGSGRYWSDDYR